MRYVGYEYEYEYICIYIYIYIYIYKSDGCTNTMVLYIIIDHFYHRIDRN